MYNCIEITVGGGNRRQMSIIDECRPSGNAIGTLDRSYLSIDFVYDLTANFPFPSDFHKAQCPPCLDQQINLTSGDASPALGPGAAIGASRSDKRPVHVQIWNQFPVVVHHKIFESKTHHRINAFKLFKRSE